MDSPFVVDHSNGLPALASTNGPASATTSPSKGEALGSRKARQPDKVRMITQLSRRLYLRLSFARLKVDHGWSKQTINEVENLWSFTQRTQNSSQARQQNIVQGLKRAAQSPPESESKPPSKRRATKMDETKVTELSDDEPISTTSPQYPAEPTTPRGPGRSTFDTTPSTNLSHFSPHRSSPVSRPSPMIPAAAASGTPKTYADFWATISPGKTANSNNLSQPFIRRSVSPSLPSKTIVKSNPSTKPKPMPPVEDLSNLNSDSIMDAGGDGELLTLEDLEGMHFGSQPTGRSR